MAIVQQKSMVSNHRLIIHANRTWTARHYLVPLIGWLAAVVYAAGLRIGFMVTGLPDPPIWVVMLSGMLAYWSGIYFSRLLLFDRRRR